MDATREHLLGRILLERRVLAEEELRRVVGERDEHLRRGGRITLAQILVRERRIDATTYAALQNEIELRGRACYTCRRAYLVQPGGPAQCPACGGPALLPALPSQAAPPPSSSTNPPAPLEDYSPSGRFPLSPSGRFAPPGSPAGPGGSTRATNGHNNGSSHRGNAFASQAVPAMPSASSRLMPSMGVSPHGSTPGHVGSTDPGSHQGHGAGTNGAQKQGAELKTLGPYDLLSELGRGGMGVVYKAQHRQTGQVVALKVLLSGEFASPKMLARFKEEAAVVQKLEHPNIVPIFEVGEIDGINYFTMKFVDGDLFQALLKGRGLSARRGAEIVRDVARGAHHAHETGIVHRDLKPANVIVERESGTPFIMDFGLAKDLDDDKGLSKTGVAIGTPYYMPPEQAQGKHREIDPRSDVYALGAMLYEVLARKVPFNAESQTLLLRKIVEEEPVPPSQIRQGVPPDLETIALTALKKRKEDRFPSAEAFAKDIERALAGKQIKAKRDPFWTPWVKKLKKNPKVIAIVGVTLVVLAAAVGYGVHFYREKQRLEAEDAARRKQAEEDQKRREAEEAALKRRTEAEVLLSKGHAKRLQARLSPNFAASRITLEDAIEAFTSAINLTDEATEPRITANYERALCYLASYRNDLLPKALDDLKAVTASKFAPARGRLAMGLIALRREHDATKARDEFEVGQSKGAPTDSAAVRDEEAASLICRAYVTGIDGATAAAVKLAQEAGPKSDDLFVEAGAAELWLRLPGITGPGAEGNELGRLVTKLVSVDKWHYWLQCDRTHLLAVLNLLNGASESHQIAEGMKTDFVDMKLIDAWIRAATQGKDELFRSTFEAARREHQAPASYWDAIERRYVAAISSLRRLAAAKKDATQNPDKKKSYAPFNDITFEPPAEARLRAAEASKLAQAGKREEAAALMKKLVEDFPEANCFKSWLGLLDLELRRPAESRALADQVLARKGDDVFALCVKGVAERELGNLDGARVAFEKAMAAQTTLRTPRILLGQVLRALGEFGALESVVKPLVSEDPGDIEAASLLSLAWVHGEKVEEGINMAKLISEGRPKLVEPRLTASLGNRRQKRYAEALSIVDEGLKINAEQPSLLVERGLVLWTMGRYDEAEDCVRRMRTHVSPDDAKSLEKLFTDYKAKHPRK